MSWQQRAVNSLFESFCTFCPLGPFPSFESCCTVFQSCLIPFEPCPCSSDKDCGMASWATCLIWLPMQWSCLCCERSVIIFIIITRPKPSFSCTSSYQALGNLLISPSAVNSSRKLNVEMRPGLRTFLNTNKKLNAEVASSTSSQKKLIDSAICWLLSSSLHGFRGR